jgi:carboxypeptidase C (cathepsin A)
MTSCKSIGTAAMVAALVSLTAVQPALAYDGVRRLPHPIVPNAPPPTEESSWQAMQQHMERRFNDAGGGGNGLTQEQARLAGWGNVSDNFKSIDRQGNGRVGLDDLKRFFQERWAQHTNGFPNWSPGNSDDWDDHVYNYPYERDVALVDTNSYVTNDPGGTIALSAVTERASLKQHTMTIKGRLVRFTARAGHLTASKVDPTGKTAVKSANGPSTPGSTPEATIFYTAYTRDDLPKENRPVTFLWNGGPGSSSIWLHMGSFGPQFLDTNAPAVPEADYMNPPASFPLEDNPITLLDKTDLVFVDPPGTGLSTAISPNTNQTLWGTDPDAQVVVDFITRYINVYNRQSSPKYLYGESYGGIRTPIVANLLEQAGTANYQPAPREPGYRSGESSEHPAKVLDGVVLGSPILDYSTSCVESFGTYQNCNAFIPNIAMVEDYLGLTSARGTLSRKDYFDRIYQFVQSPDFIEYNNNCNGANWTSYIVTPSAQRVVKKLQNYIGAPNTFWGAVDWTQSYACSTVNADYLTYTIATSYKIGDVTGFYADAYDGRVLVPTTASYSASDFPNTAYYNQFIAYLTTFVNYSNEPASETGTAANSDYNTLSDAIDYWDFSHDGNNYAESVTDIAAALAADPNLKFSILHGWDDFVCPETEALWDLENANLSKSVPIQTFEGGHMTYQTDSSRPELKNALDAFYRATRGSYFESDAKVAASAGR